MNTVAGIKLQDIKQTAFACPSQWEGRTVDGRFVYVRYRWGSLTVGIADTFIEAIMKETYVDICGGPMDGYMTIEEMLDKTGLIIKGR